MFSRYHCFDLADRIYDDDTAPDATGPMTDGQGQARDDQIGDNEIAPIEMDSLFSRVRAWLGLP